MKQLTDHFTLHEFRCRCGCGAEWDWVEECRKTAEILELLRERINSKQEYIQYREQMLGERYRELPVIINCGVRCPKHNKDVGGAKASYHLSFIDKGIREQAYRGAADTWAPGLPTELWFKETEGLFRGRILYTKKNFVHVDRRIGNAYNSIKEA